MVAVQPHDERIPLTVPKGWKLGRDRAYQVRKSSEFRGRAETNECWVFVLILSSLHARRYLTVLRRLLNFGGVDRIRFALSAGGQKHERY